jgi:hypothetical protein
MIIHPKDEKGQVTLLPPGAAGGFMVVCRFFHINML